MLFSYNHHNERLLFAFKRIFLSVFVFFAMLLSAHAQLPDKVKDGMVNFNKAEEFRKAKNWALAIQYYQKAAGENPLNINFFLQQAKCYYILKDFENALKQYAKVADMQNDHIEANAMLARLYLQRRDFPNAIKFLDKSFTYEADKIKRVTYKIQIINILYKEKKFNEVGKHIQDAYQIAPNQVDVLFCKARYHNQKSEYLKAVECLERVVEKLPRDSVSQERAKYFFQLGFAYFHSGQYDKASEILKLANIGPFKGPILRMQPEYFLQIANAHYKIFDYATAKNYLELCLKIRKDFVGANQFLAKLGEDLADKSATIHKIKVMLETEKDPIKQSNYNKELASLYFKNAKYSDALTAIDNALKNQPVAVPLLFLKGRIVYELGKKDESLNIIKALFDNKTIDPEMRSQFAFALGVMLIKANKGAEAVVYLKQVQSYQYKTAASMEIEKIEGAQLFAGETEIKVNEGSEN
ncbi:MAG: hypothetical protein EAZ57_05060 [Cytophagales bacterium]|nr:MAG: hypothetical protein EAZ67_00820 [Cytophagales bacterium]TAF61158.1 MAG: hypothetical protein EAZ57_05060 [Cytophagales bacterium]